MKKKVFLAFLLLSLGGCASRKLNSKLSSTNDNLQTEMTETITAQTMQSNSDIQENFNNFEEKGKISMIFSPDNFNITELVDNSEKRILLFSKNNQKFYKSIYIKSTNVLKVIDIKNNEKEIFYGSI